MSYPHTITVGLSYGEAVTRNTVCPFGAWFRVIWLMLAAAELMDRWVKWEV
ncbi:hypothetical protein [Arthrobacter sp. lap29]|uniref:hypothetical protein n=1 Tax=Arthrobacter sp. lap29 TaxID=3056122 RepID=UPI0028F6EF4F|nr:hypothetical protein [Arthrobacter sp. lap29]